MHILEWGKIMIERVTKKSTHRERTARSAIIVGVLLSGLSLLVHLGSEASYAPASGSLLRYDYYALLYAPCRGGTRAGLYIVCLYDQADGKCIVFKADCNLKAHLHFILLPCSAASNMMLVPLTLLALPLSSNYSDQIWISRVSRLVRLLPVTLVEFCLERY